MIDLSLRETNALIIDVANPDDDAPISIGFATRLLIKPLLPMSDQAYLFCRNVLQIEMPVKGNRAQL
jgi:hypothetical protein